MGTNAAYGTTYDDTNEWNIKFNHLLENDSLIRIMTGNGKYGIEFTKQWWDDFFSQETSSGYIQVDNVPLVIWDGGSYLNETLTWKNDIETTDTSHFPLIKLSPLSDETIPMIGLDNMDSTGIFSTLYMEDNISLDALHSDFKNENEGIHVYIRTPQNWLPPNTPTINENDWYDDTINVKLFGDNTEAGNNGFNRVSIQSLSIIEEHSNRTLASMGSNEDPYEYPDSPFDGGWHFTLKSFNDIKLKWQLGSYEDDDGVIDGVVHGGGDGDVPNVNYYIIDDSDGMEMYSSKAINLHPRNLGLLPDKLSLIHI